MVQACCRGSCQADVCYQPAYIKHLHLTITLSYTFVLDICDLICKNST